jgi:hypothetical protein
MEKKDLELALLVQIRKNKNLELELKFANLKIAQLEKAIYGFESELKTKVE